jgi:hypothetical protein
MNTESNDNDPYADLDAIPGRLEDAIEAVTGERPHTDAALANGMTRGMRGGAAAGILISAAMDTYYALALGSDGKDMDVHHALVVALESCAGENRVAMVHTIMNMLTTWLDSPNMVEQIGPQSAAAIQHLETAYDHIASGAGLQVDDDDEGPGVRVMTVHGMDDVPFAPMSAPSGAIDRLGEAASALGISPIINVEGDDENHDHPIVPVAVMSGLVIGRATMELIDMVGSADDHLRAHSAPLFVNGFTQGVAFGAEPRDDVVAAAALRLVHIIGLWHDHRHDAPYAPAIGALCRAANHAGRAGGLSSSEVDVRAEYIANYGADENDAARKALAAAEEAVKALKDTGVTM